MKSKHWAVPEPPPQQPAISGLDFEALQRCIHCGFCIENCPTYRQTRLETASPRGRIAMMRAVAEGRIPLDERFAEALDLCLGCRACESACPNGVPYGHLVEEARVLSAKVVPPPWVVRMGLKHLMPYPNRMRLIGRMVGWAQRSGLLGWLVRRSWLPAAAMDLAAALPPVEAATPFPEPAEPKALYFHGCVQEGVLPQQNRAAVRLLERLDLPCSVPVAQTCCGALHMHQGDVEAARALARQNIAAFESIGENLPVINHAGGCGAQLKQYGELLAGDPVWAERAKRFTARVRDLSEWLVEVGAHRRLAELANQRQAQAAGGGTRVRVTYQDSCHLAHGQKVRSQPRALVKAMIPPSGYMELPAADQCCGSAGIYNLLQPDMASAILDEKMGNVQRTQATVVVTANPGCHLQLCQGVKRAGLADHVRVLSVAEFIEEQLAALDAQPAGCSCSKAHEGAAR